MISRAQSSQASTPTGSIALAGTKGGASINPAIGLSHWRQAVANAMAGTGNARLVMYGDSITQGYTDGSGTEVGALTNGTPGRLRGLFQGFFGANGDGISWLFTGAIYTDTRLVTTGAVAKNVGPFGLAGLQVAGVAQNFTFTPLNAGDTFVVYYLTGPSYGQFTAACAAGSVVINANAASNGYASTTLATNSSYAIDTLTITGVAGNTAAIVAVDFKSASNSNISVSWCALQGKMASDLLGTPAAAQGSLALGFDMVAPDLSIIQFGANEYATQTPVATYKSNLQTIITRAKQTGDVMIVVTVPQTPGAAIPMASYTAALYQLAATNNVVVVDLYKRWTSFAVSNPLGLYANSVHPSFNGYQDIALALFDATTSFIGNQGPLTRALRQMLISPNLVTPVMDLASFGSLANSQKINLFGLTYGLGIDGSDLVLYANTATGISFKDTTYNGGTTMRVRVGTTKAVDIAGNLTLTTAGNKLGLAAATTASASINLPAGTAPTSPNDGDIWYDGTNLKMRVGGVTKTFTLA